MDFQEFNLADPELAKSSRQLLPVGEYVCTVSDATEKANSAGTGSFLALQFAIIDGDYFGRSIYENLNLKNPNPTAVNIARARLKELLEALAIPGARSPAEIVGRDVVVKIRHYKDKATGEIRQAVGGFRNPTAAPKPAGARQAPPLQQQPAQAPTQTSAPAQRQPVRPGTASAPWG